MVYTWVKLRMAKNMEMAYLSIKRSYSRDSFMWIRKSRAIRKIKLEGIMEDSKKEKDMAMVSFIGLMGKSLRENGKMVRNKVMVYGLLLREILMTASGIVTHKMGKVSSYMLGCRSTWATTRIF